MKEDPKFIAEIRELVERLKADEQPTDPDFWKPTIKRYTTLLAYIDVLSQALRVARHEMVTSRGVHATDRPDLVTMPPILSWVIDPSKAIETVDKALSWTPEEGE